jgi:RNA polymerase sigma-70 factor, ECF subfamily
MVEHNRKQTKPMQPLEIEELIRSYYPAVVRLALSILDNGQPGSAVRDEAEDAAQETFIAAARSLDEFHGSSSPKTWLFAIAINNCRSRLRKRRASQALAAALASIQRVLGGGDMPGAGDPQRLAERAERDALLWAAVDGLDEKHRLVVVLRYAHELTAAEIAQALDISEGTVHSRLHYARQKLAGQLRQSAALEEVVL